VRINRYAGTSTLEIAKRAIVSKREIYAVCEGKGTLFRDRTAECGERMLASARSSGLKGPALAAMLTLLTGARARSDLAERAVYLTRHLGPRKRARPARLRDEVGRGATRAALTRTARAHKPLSVSRFDQIRGLSLNLLSP
jgi:hypothetical protein